MAYEDTLRKYIKEEVDRLGVKSTLKDSVVFNLTNLCLFNNLERKLFLKGYIDDKKDLLQAKISKINQDKNIIQQDISSLTIAKTELN